MRLNGSDFNPALHGHLILQNSSTEELYKMSLALSILSAIGVGKSITTLGRGLCCSPLCVCVCVFMSVCVCVCVGVFMSVCVCL